MLGTLQVLDGDTTVDIGPPKQRAVLAVLLLAQGRVVSTDRLVDAVWGDDVPGSATASLQAYISNLRKALRAVTGAASPIVRQAPGYYLDAAPELVDLAEFTRQCACATTAVESADWRTALDAADTALALWRGPLLDDFRDEHWVTQDAARLDDMRVDCMENRLTALLALGRIQTAVTDAAVLRTADPLRDRGCWLQMLTLYRAGRGPDALDVFTRHAALLDDELGLEPGHELRDLQSAILRQAPELSAWPRSPEWTGAHDVSSPSSAHAQAASALEAPRVELVGRERELATITTMLAAARAGDTRWLICSGPAGIGKTRLAEEAVARMVDAGASTVWVSCPDERGTPPWWPMRQLVRALGADADELWDAVADSDPDAMRFRVYERIQTLLEAHGPAPLCVVVDDVQWSDTTSASCLAYLAGALRDKPIAVILTVRDGDHGPEVARLLSTAARGVGNRHIEVPALSSADVAVLANQVADDDVTDAEVEALARRTGGNPFFVSEYARLPREERGTDMPLAVKSVLDRRLANLDPAVLQVLRTAAVIGDAIDVPVLAATTRLDLDTLADYLDDAADERIIVGAHTGGGYAFAHGLLREQLLSSMPALRRQRLHALVAEVLVDSAADDAVSRRAQHLVAAQPLVEPHAVVQACRLAAEEATQRWSSDIAAGWWEAAIGAYDQLPAAVRSDVERDALTVARLEALARAGRGRTVLDTVEAHVADALRAGRAASAGRVASALLRAGGGWPWLAPGQDPGELLVLLDRAASAAGDDPAAAARLRATLAVGHCYHPDAAVATSHLDSASELAELTGDFDVIADVLMARLITYSGVAEKSEITLRWVADLIALPHSRIREDTVIAHSVATMAAFNLGDVDATRHHLRAGIAGSEELQLPVLRAQLRWTEAVMAVWTGDFAEARRHHEIAARVHEQTELYEAGSGLVAAVCLLRELGQNLPDGWLGDREPEDAGGQSMIAMVRAAALTAVDSVWARDDAIGILTAWPNRPKVFAWTTLGHAATLAHLAADHGLAEFATMLLAELAPYRDRIANIGQVGVMGPVALATARLSAMIGDHAAARADLTRARALADRTGALPSALRCRLLAAQLGDDDARAVAREAAALGMMGVHAAAERLV